MPRSVSAFLFAVAVTVAAAAGAPWALAQSSGWEEDVVPGWRVMPTPYGFDELVKRLDRAVQDNEMLLVTRASASMGAKNRGITIPGNTVVGVFRNDYALRMLEASVPAGIEAPIRFYITENEDGTATLSYKTPSTVFAPYRDGNGDLRKLAEELDGIFAEIADQAAAP